MAATNQPDIGIDSGGGPTSPLREELEPEVRQVKDRLARLLRLTREPALVPIKRTLQLDDNEWVGLLHLFADIPDDFHRYAAQWSTVKKRRNKIVKAARACADVILSNDISPYWESALSWDEASAAPWAEIFLPLIAPDDIRDNLEWLGGAINHIGTKRAFSEIPALLLRFVETLERLGAEGDESLAEELTKSVSRKNSLREFAKRRVFKLLRERWPSQLRDAPNKETATIVNCLLGLSGHEQVTANDISQMNKSTRRRYVLE